MNANRCFTNLELKKAKSHSERTRGADLFFLSSRLTGICVSLCFVCVKNIFMIFLHFKD